MRRPEPTHDDFGRRLDLDESTRPGEQETTVHVPTNAAGYEALAEGLTALNEELLSNRDLPPIYDSGVVYHSKRRGAVWRNARDTFEQRWGNCVDLASWRAAELRTTGEDPSAFVYVYRSGRRKFHAVVGRGDESIEDPSYALGMRVPSGWRPIQRVGDTRYHGPGSPEAVEGVEMMRTMDRHEDADADDTYDEPGGFSDLQGVYADAEGDGEPSDEADERWYSGQNDEFEVEGGGDINGDGYTDGDGMEGETEGDEVGQPPPANFDPRDPNYDPAQGGIWATGDEGSLPPDYDPNWDPGEGGEALRAGPGTEALPPGYDPNWDAAEGGEPPSVGWEASGPDSGVSDYVGQEFEQGPEEGEDQDSEQADDQAEAGPEPVRPRPQKKRSLARRIYHGARRAHSFARSLSPTHQLAKRIPGVRRFSRFILGEEPAIGVGADCAPECGNEATFDVYRTGKGWSGVVRIPTDQGRALMMATSPSPTKDKAASKAVNLTRLAASSPALQAMVPPQAKLALMAAQHPLAKKALRAAFRRG